MLGTCIKVTQYISCALVEIITKLVGTALEVYRSMSIGVLNKLKKFFSPKPQQDNSLYDLNFEELEFESDVKLNENFLRNEEIPVIAEYATFYSAGFVKGKGKAIIVVEKKIFNA